MDIEKLKCVLCQKIPDADVYECAGQHLGCKACVEKLNVRLCKCSEYFDKQKDNPIVQLLKQTQTLGKTPCPYKSGGCSWHFVAAKDLQAHTQECKFRPYQCIASKLGLIVCNWSGLQHEIEAHLKKDHAVLGSAFSYYQESEIPFSTANTKTSGSIKLVDAFNKQFLFYFSSNVDKQMVYFMIIYFGRREEAHQYYYEFEIRHRNALDVRRAKFVEECIADSEDLAEKIENEECIALSYKTVKRYLQNEAIPFRFIVKKFEKEAETKAIARERRTSEDSKSNKPKPTPFVFPQKGKLKTNLSRSASASSSAASNGGGATKKPTPKPNNDPPLRKISAPAGPSPLFKSSPPPVSSEQKTPEFSSINRVGVSGQDSPILHQEPCPLLSPSINRLDAPPAYSALTSRFSEHHYSISEYSLTTINRLPPVETKTTASLCQRFTQPYKMADERLFLQRYPETCLNKPAFRR